MSISPVLEYRRRRLPDFDQWGVTWRFLSVDLVTETVIGELKPISLKWEHKENEAGSWSAMFPLDTIDPRLIDPWRSAIYIERNGAIIFAGIVESARADGSARVVEAIGPGMLGYLDRRVVRYNHRFDQVAQAEIAHRMIEARALYRGIGLVPTVVEPSVILRDRTYEAWSRSTVGQILKNLSEVIDGIDMEMRLFPTGPNTWERRVLLSDQLGRDTGIVLAAGVNLAAYGQQVDGSVMANRVSAVGEGEEEDMLIAEAAVANMDGYPLLDTVTSYKTVSRLTTLQEHADGDLADRKVPLSLPSLSLSNPRNPAPGSWRAGDTVQVLLDDHWMNYDGRAKIVGWSTTLDRDNGETVTFEVVPQRDQDIA